MSNTLKETLNNLQVITSKSAQNGFFLRDIAANYFTLKALDDESIFKENCSDQESLAKYQCVPCLAIITGTTDLATSSTAPTTICLLAVFAFLA